MKIFVLGDKTKSNFCFAHHNLSELRLTSGEHQFPSEAFQPDYTNNNFGREFGSLYSPGGAIGLSFKSDFSIGRVKISNYADSFALYRVSFLRNVVHTLEYDETLLEPRFMTPSLDIHLRFSEKLTTDVALVTMALYDDSFFIQRDDVSTRNVLINYAL